ncbi:hypothetical protein GW927_00785 [Candidatus Pacearchaeota archaeon]|nr:hypothetical protein [Candidatus Pacearchaeota archaeon]
MRYNSPLKMEKEITKEKSSTIDGTVFLVLLTAAISLLDFYSHPNGGLADPERRKILLETIGPITKHLGNYGFTAGFAISAVFVKNLFQEAFHSEIAQKIIKQGYIFSAASILTLNALVEIFPKNNEVVGDISVAVLALIMAIPASELAIQKFKKAKLENK